MIAPDSMRHRARRAAETLRGLILEGRWPDGLLPSAWELERELDVGRNALREALAQLGSEGMLRRARGIGIVAGTGRVEYAAARLTTLDEDAVDARGVDHVLVTWREEAASAAVASQLGVALGAPTVLYERLTRDPEPLAFWSTRLRADTMPPPCAVGDSISHGYYAQLERAGVVFGEAVLRTSAAPANPAIADVLGVAQGTVVLVQHRVLHAVDDAVIDVSMGYFRSDRVMLSERAGRRS